MRRVSLEAPPPPPSTVNEGSAEADEHGEAARPFSSTCMFSNRPSYTDHRLSALIYLSESVRRAYLGMFYYIWQRRILKGTRASLMFVRLYNLARCDSRVYLGLLFCEWQRLVTEDNGWRRITTNLVRGLRQTTLHLAQRKLVRETERASSSTCIASEGSSHIDYHMLALIRLSEPVPRAHLGMIYCLWLLCVRKANTARHDANLHSAIQRNDHGRITRLVMCRADVNAADRELRQTPLHVAAMHCCPTVVDLLLAQRASLEAKDAAGNTPILLAAASGNIEAVRCLTGKRADLKAENDMQHDSVRLAASAGHFAVTQFLVESWKHDRWATVEEATVHRPTVHKRYVDLRLREAMAETIRRGNRELTMFLLQANHYHSDIRCLLGTLQKESPWCKAFFDELLCGRNAECVLVALGHHFNGEAKFTSSSVRTVEAQVHNFLERDLGERLVRNGGIQVFPSKLVRAKVSVCKVPGVCSLDVVDGLAHTPNDEVFDTVLVNAIMQSAWSAIQWCYFVDLSIAFGNVMLMCIAASDLHEHGASSAGTIVCLAVIAIKGLTEELQHMTREITVHGCGIYFISVGTLADWFMIALDIGSIAVLCGYYGGPVQRGVFAAACAACWLRSLFQLRCLLFIGPRLLPILYATADTFVFFFVFGTAVCAAIHAYYVIGARDVPGPLYAAVMPIMRLTLLGDIDLFEFEGEDTVYSEGEGEEESSRIWFPDDPEPTDKYVNTHVIFYAVAICITVVLMNILIGVLGRNYDHYEDVSHRLFLRTRAHAIVAYRTRCWSAILRSWRTASPRQVFLWILHPEDMQVNDTRSLHTSIERAKTEYEERLDKLETLLVNKLSHIEEQLSGRTAHLVDGRLSFRR